MKTIKIIKSKTNTMPLLKFIRGYHSEWSILQCMDWVKSLPQEIGPFNEKSEFENVLQRISNIAEIEMFGEWEPEPVNCWGETKPPEVLEAEKWMLNLPQEDQDKINTILYYAITKSRGRG